MYYSTEIPADHITDHLPFRSTRKQWTGEWRRARFSRRKGAEKAIFSGNCLHRSVWDHQAAGSNPVTRTSMSVHNGFMLWTLILLFNFIRFVCGEQVLCLLTFCLMRISLWEYTPHLRPSGCWLCSFRHLMTVVLNNRQNNNR